MLFHGLIFGVIDLAPSLHDKCRPAFSILILAFEVPIFIVEEGYFEVLNELVKSSGLNPMLSKIHKFLCSRFSLRFQWFFGKA